MKKVFHLVSAILTIVGLLVFSWHLTLLSRLDMSNTTYFLNRLIMALWLAIPGFALELPRLWPYLTGKKEARTDWWFLLINGIPAFVFAWLPFFVAVAGLPFPDLLLKDPAVRLTVEGLGAYWLGVSLAKSIVLKE